MNTRELMGREVKLINTMLKRNDVRAKVEPKQTVNVAVGYISYESTAKSLKWPQKHKIRKNSPL